MGSGSDYALRQWLIHLADPMAVPGRRPSLPLEGLDLDRLARLAEAHGVLPAVLRNLVAADLPPVRSPEAQGSIRRMSERRAAVVGLSMLLTRRGGEIVDALRHAGVPALVVKGAAMARRAYPEPALRTFTDIDILVPSTFQERAGSVLAKRGFAATVEDYGRRSDRGERKWIAGDATGILVEIHTDLVGSPKLRGRVSLGFDDVVDTPGGEPTPEALMLIACVHGATGHQFDRLQHLVDIVQLARGAAGHVDVRALRRRAQRAGGLYAVKWGLELAGRVFGEPRCLELAGGLGRVRFAALARRLLSSSVVIEAQEATRHRASWRRKIARELIVWSR